MFADKALLFIAGKTDVLVSNGNCHENASFEIGISSKAIYGDVNTSSGSSGHTTASNVSTFQLLMTI